jgi:DNA primase
MNNTDIIKDKLNILDVVGSYVKLEKAGKTYKGKSPFTNEKTPSFFVSPEKGFFYCFSSGKGGDIFSFIQEIERVDFREALKILAEKAGISLESGSANDEVYKKTDRLFSLIDAAAKWYEVNLRKDPEVINYLLDRGLTKETIIKFRIGFAKNDWREIYNYLKSRKYSDQEIQDSGLSIKKEGSGYYDRFRSRIMFPLMDARGRIVGFSGRIFGEDSSDIKGAKYVNSPETLLFNKSKVLYGYHTAKNTISKENKCILVEGQFDVLLCQQVGYSNTVAISGTGLNDSIENLQNQDNGLDYNFGSQVQMIKRFTNNLFIALDSDNAGIKATRRSVLSAYQHGMNVRVILLPEGMDPADVIRKSKEQWDVCVGESLDYIDYRLEIFERADKTFEEKKSLVENDIFTFVHLVTSAIIQDKIIQKLALFLGVTVQAVRNDFKNFKPENIELFIDKPIKNVEILGEKVESQKLEVSQRTKNILFLWGYIQDQEIPIDDEILKKIQETHKNLYQKTFDKHIQEIPTVERNMETFVRNVMYKNKSPKSFGTDLLSELSQEYMRSIDIQAKNILREIRQAEGRGDKQKIQELNLENTKILSVKTDLEKNI